MKACHKCFEIKPISNFSIDVRLLSGYSSECKQCRCKYVQSWQDKNPNKKSTYYYKYNYGLSIEQYDTLLKSQDYKCKICGINQKDFYEKLSVDHCHKTNKVRGLLCGSCNRAIGQFKDNPIFCDKAAEYLRENNEEAKKERQKKHNSSKTRKARDKTKTKETLGSGKTDL